MQWTAMRGASKWLSLAWLCGIVATNALAHEGHDHVVQSVPWWQGITAGGWSSGPKELTGATIPPATYGERGIELPRN